jgi:hypothetical protein
MVSGFPYRCLRLSARFDSLQFPSLISLHKVQNPNFSFTIVSTENASRSKMARKFEAMKSIQLAIMNFFLFSLAFVEDPGSWLL